MKRIYAYLIALLFAASVTAAAQESFGGIAQLDETVHNFGDVLISDGPVSCTFTVTNISDKPIAIHSVVSSCGCTNVTWTKAPIAAGKTGTISATYSNDEGPYPFEKTLSAYVSNVNKPIILRLRGVSIQKKEPLEKVYSVHYGSLGLKESEIKIGNMEQGSAVSEEVLVANLSKSPLKVDFRDVDPDLTIKVTPNPIPAGSTAKLQLSAKANRSKWGKNYYKATPVVAGKTYGTITGWAVTKESFSSYTKEQRDAAPKPMFETSTYSFGKVKAGKKIEATFAVTNKGKTAFEVYKADCESNAVSAISTPKVAAGGKATYKMNLDTTGMPSGEVMIIVSLITNSPNRPLINLFLTGWIE